MTKQQVEALRAAGINESAIIDRILQDMQDPEPAPAGDPAPAEDPAPEETPKTPAAPADRTDEILDAIRKLTGAIQTGNQHRGREAAPEQSVDDILASVLTPAGKKK